MKFFMSIALMTVTSASWASAIVYPYADLSQEELGNAPISVCLTTSSLAMQAMNDRQSNKPSWEGLKDALSLSITQVDTDGFNDFYKAFIQEQYHLAYAHPIMDTHQEKHTLVKQLRDKELKRCGDAYGVDNIGQYLIYFSGYTDLRPKDFVWPYDEVN